MSKSTELDKTVKTYLIESIDFEGHDKQPETVEDALQMVQEEFERTHTHDIRRYGYSGAIREWLMGLPSTVKIEFSNYAILQLAVEWGSIPEDYTTKQADKILDNYWSLMAVKLNQLFEGYRVPKNMELSV